MNILTWVTGIVDLKVFAEFLPVLVFFSYAKKSKMHHFPPEKSNGTTIKEMPKELEKRPSFTEILEFFRAKEVEDKRCKWDPESENKRGNLPSTIFGKPRTHPQGNNTLGGLPGAGQGNAGPGFSENDVSA